MKNIKFFFLSLLLTLTITSCGSSDVIVNIYGVSEYNCTTDEYRISIAGDICVDSLNCLDPVMMDKKNDYLYPKTS